MRSRQRDPNQSLMQPFVSNVHQSQFTNNISKLNESAKHNNQMFFRRTTLFDDDHPIISRLKKGSQSKTPGVQTLHDKSFKRSSPNPMDITQPGSVLNSMNSFNTFLENDSTKLKIFKQFKAMSRELARAYMR